MSYCGLYASMSKYIYLRGKRPRGKSFEYALRFISEKGDNYEFDWRFLMLRGVGG